MSTSVPSDVRESARESFEIRARFALYVSGAAWYDRSMTTTRTIKVTTLDYAAQVGAYIVEPDDDYAYGTFVPNDAYDVDNMDWQRVVSRRGHADIGELTLAYYDGSQYVARAQRWDAIVWLLCDASGVPITDDIDA
jgi:hypothetical protein